MLWKVQTLWGSSDTTAGATAPAVLGQQGKRQINCGGERGWALLPHTSTQDFCFPSRCLCHQVTTTTRCFPFLCERSQCSVHRTDGQEGRNMNIQQSKVSILQFENASFSNLSSIVSIKILSHYNSAILFKHQQHVWPYSSYLTKIISEFPQPKCLQSRLKKSRKHWYRHPKEISTIQIFLLWKLYHLKSSSSFRVVHLWLWTWTYN